MRSRSVPARVAIAVTVAVLVAVLTALATVAARQIPSASKRPEGAACGTSTCIPYLKFDDVIAVVKSHGYTCEQLGGGWTQCGLKVGITTFDFAAEPKDGLIARLGASVKIRDGAVPYSDKAIAFVQWVAALPLAANPTNIAQVHTWVRDRINAGRGTEATINGYKYHLTLSSRVMDLDIFYDYNAGRQR